jgi:hypothetical protein
MLQMEIECVCLGHNEKVLYKLWPEVFIMIFMVSGE